MDTLSGRKRVILINSIAEYIRSATPITSSMVQEITLKDVSTATLRNELNALEAMGYLKQLHTSSGRVPTSKAYRLYVESMMNEVRFKPGDLDVVDERFNIRANNLSSVIDSVAKTISKVTNYPTIAVMNDLKRLTIEDIQLIPLIDFSCLMLIKTSGGTINNTFGISSAVTKEDCFDSEKILKERYLGSTIADMIESIESTVKDANEVIVKYKEIFESVIGILKKASSSFHHGETKLLNQPEYKSVEKAKQIIDIIENEEELQKALEVTSDDMSFSIGQENESEALRECAVVKAPIKIGDETVGTVGVIGPQRLDYELVAGALSFVINELKQINRLTGGDNNGKKE